LKTLLNNYLDLFCEFILFGSGERSNLARDARSTYLRELTTEEFLCRIDIFRELDSYDARAR
jgi:hypothetical protein